MRWKPRCEQKPRQQPLLTSAASIQQLNNGLTIEHRAPLSRDEKIKMESPIHGRDSHKTQLQSTTDFCTTRIQYWSLSLPLCISLLFSRALLFARRLSASLDHCMCLAAIASFVSPFLCCVAAVQCCRCYNWLLCACEFTCVSEWFRLPVCACVSSILPLYVLAKMIQTFSSSELIFWVSCQVFQCDYNKKSVERELLLAALAAAASGAAASKCETRKKREKKKIYK